MFVCKDYEKALGLIKKRLIQYIRRPCLCYSVVEVIDFISAHNPPFGIDVMVNVKYRKESAK